MDEAVALAMATTADDDDSQDNDDNDDQLVGEEKVDESVNKATSNSTPIEDTRMISTPPLPKHSTNNDREAQQQETYYRRNQELNLTKRYAPNDRCWLIGFLMRGPFQLCMK